LISNNQIVEIKGVNDEEKLTNRLMIEETETNPATTRAMIKKRESFDG